MSATPHRWIKVKAQVFNGGAIAMGPGKADLLEAIAQEGSISAAGRALGMSYRRTWLLVDTMNHNWRSPLVATTVGGRKGAALTDLGREVLAAYRALDGRFAKVAAGPEAALLLGLLGVGLTAPEPPEPQ